MSATSDSDRRQEADAGQSAGTAATSAAAVPAKTTAWVPKVKQQQSQSGDRRSSTSSSTGHVHDLGSDPILASGSESGTGKGKNRSKNKKMNWKPLPVPIIRRDPDRDRDRDIRGMSARKYGTGSSTGSAAAGASSGGRSHKLANGFRQNSAPAASSAANASISGHVQQQLSHPATGTTGSSHNSADPRHGHPPLPSQHSQHHNNNHNHHQNQSAQSNSSDESKLQRSSSISSSSSSSRPNNHHPHHHNHPPHHQHQMPQKQQQPDPNAQQHSDQTSSVLSNASDESSGTKFSNNNNSSNNNNNNNHQRMVNGSNRLPAAARAPVLRSAGPSPPASPATQPHHQSHSQQHNRRQPTPDHHQQQQHHPQHQSQHPPYYGRRSGTRVTSGSTNGGSGRATPNSLKDFSPEVQFFPVEFAALNHDMSGNAQMQLSNKTSGLMSPVLTLPPGAVVVQGPAFAGPAAAAPFYPPYATAIPVVTAGSAGHAVAAGPAAAVSVPSGLIPVSAFTMPSLPSDPLHGHPHHNHPVPLMDMIRAQIEYYFSEKNLVLTPDITVIIRSLENSPTVELSQDHLKARPRINPHQWPMTTTDMGLSPPPVLSPMSPLSASGHHSPSASTHAFNGQPDADLRDQRNVLGKSVSHAPVKSQSHVRVAADHRNGSAADSATRDLHQLQLSEAGDDGKAETISESTGASNPDQNLQKQQQSSSSQRLDTSAAGGGSNGSVVQQSSSAVSSSATGSEVTPAATASPPASDASAASLHPDVPSFVPGQLYAAVVSSSNGRV